MAKQVQGRKWKVPVKAKNKNCYNLTDIDLSLKGVVPTEKHNRYRAIFNAVIGGNTLKKVPPIGKFDIDDKERVLIKSVTKLILARDFVIIFRGNSISKINLAGIQTLEGLYNNTPMAIKEIRQYIQMLEKAEDLESLQKLPIFAGIYRDMLLNKEKTAPNEKKTMVDVLTNNLCIFSGIDEVVLLVDTFTQVGVTTALGQKLAAMIPDYSEKLATYANAELNKEICGVLDLKRKIENKKVKFDNLKVVSLIRGNILPLMQGYKAEQTVTDYLKGSGLDCRIVYLPVSQKVIEKEDNTSENIAKMREQVETELSKAVYKWGRYSKLVRLGNFYYEQANDYEKNLWLENFTISKFKKHIEEEFLYLRTLENSNSQYKKTLPLGAFKLLLTEDMGKEDKANSLHTLKVLASKYSKDDRHTPKSLGWNLETKEGLRLIIKAIVELDIFIDNMIDVINGLIYCTLAEFLTRFGAQGIIFTDKMVAMLKDNEEFPFMYTKEILETANRCFRADKGILRGQEDSEGNLGMFSDWVKKCILFLNPNAIAVKETDNKQEVQEIVYQQVCLIFEQYKKYLMVE